MATKKEVIAALFAKLAEPDLPMEDFEETLRRINLLEDIKE